jgi:hypothetical protein
MTETNKVQTITYPYRTKSREFARVIATGLLCSDYQFTVAVAIRNKGTDHDESIYKYTKRGEAFSINSDHDIDLPEGKLLE